MIPVEASSSGGTLVALSVMTVRDDDGRYVASMTDQRGIALPATATEIRQAAGRLDEALLLDILAVGATAEEIREAFAWLQSDDFLHRKLRHTARGRVARVIELLEADLSPPDRR